jgi:hypothetical protein
VPSGRVICQSALAPVSRLPLILGSVKVPRVNGTIRHERPPRPQSRIQPSFETSRGFVLQRLGTHLLPVGNKKGTGEYDEEL